MTDDVVQALESMNARSGSFPFFVRPLKDVERLFNRCKPQEGFTPEVAEWMELNGFRFFADFFVRVNFEGSDRVAFFFRTEELGSHFKLRWL
jgi:hypothetical protein